MGILSVRGTLPDHRYPQQEITDAFAAMIATAGGLDERLLRRVHANAGVEQRHLVLPLEEYGRRTTCSSHTLWTSVPGRWSRRSRPRG